MACALISIANLDEKFDQKVLQGAIYPNKNGVPSQNTYGVYGIKLVLNGCLRLVEIDDYLPVGAKSHMLGRTKESEFGVALLEKAIMKVYGKSYASFKTSPSIEMHHFTGWIPETVKFGDVSNKVNLWTRMKQNFRDGNIILSICRDGPTVYEPEKTNDPSILAVLDIKEYKSSKLIKCQNPTGGFTNYDIYKPNEMNSMTGELVEPVMLAKGTNRKIETSFWINWDDILANFTYISLCWNPDIYPFKRRIHSTWKNTFYENEKPSNSLFYDERFSMEYSPQFIFTIPPHKEDFEVRIFLQRHMRKYGGNGDFVSFKLFSYEG